MYFIHFVGFITFIFNTVIAVPKISRKATAGAIIHFVDFITFIFNIVIAVPKISEISRKATAAAIIFGKAVSQTEIAL